MTTFGSCVLVALGWGIRLVLLAFSLTMALSAQVPQQLQQMNQTIQDANDLRNMQTYESAPNTAVIIVHAFADEKPVSLDRSVRVDLTNLANRLGVFQTVQGHQTAVFVNTSLGKYDISATAVG